MTRVLVATSEVNRERSDLETAPLAAALARRGVDVAVRPWDDAGAGWAAADLVAIRTTWDYSVRLDEFLTWAADVEAATRLRNPLAVLRWNTHKRYLVALAESGVPTVPTTLLARGSTVPDLGAGPVVVKPAVSAGGRDTHLGSGGELTPVIAELLPERDMLVQPAVESIGRDGEVSLIRLGDRWSHAVRKVPAPGAFLVHERHGGSLSDHTPTTEEIAVADAALACAPSPVVAARVDLVRTDGHPVVMELELVEPELFLRRAPDAADRLADALLASV